MGCGASKGTAGAPTLSIGLGAFPTPQQFTSATPPPTKYAADSARLLTAAEAAQPVVPGEAHPVVVAGGYDDVITINPTFTLQLAPATGDRGRSTIVHSGSPVIKSAQQSLQA